MKKSDKKKIGKNILNGVLRFAKSATIANPVVNMGVGAVQGIVKSVQNEKEKNLQSEHGGQGKIDIPSMIGAIGGFVIVVGGAIAMIKGWLTIDDLKAIIKIWESTQ
jgi:glutamate mutase epsilon subunit